MKADAEVGAEEQQLSTALAVESKETGKKRAPRERRGSPVGWEDKTLLIKEDLVSLDCVLGTQVPC